MDIKPKHSMRKNSIDRWTPSIDNKDIQSNENFLPCKEVNDRVINRVVLPSLRNKFAMAKSISDTKNINKKRMIFTIRDSMNNLNPKPFRFIYTVKSPVPKKKSQVNYISLSPFTNDDVLSASPRYHYGQEYIKSIFTKK